MECAERDLLAIPRGVITAPAGCGKTQLIVKAIAAYCGKKPVLVLTHTNAGVAALRSRLRYNTVSANVYRLHTIDGWAMRLVAFFPKRSGHHPEFLDGDKPDYQAIRDAASKLLKSGHVNEVLKASYQNLIVDEYQDCSLAQHEMVKFLSQLFHTVILGDPMQAIFGFRNNSLVDWNTDVCAHFSPIGSLEIPWRWKNVGAEELGAWLLDVRKRLVNNEPVDLQKAPSHFVKWFKLPEDYKQRLTAIRRSLSQYFNRKNALIIADSSNINQQRTLARNIYGVSLVEAVELTDLMEFCESFEVKGENALVQVLEFAQKMMTQVYLKKMIDRLECLQRKTEKKSPDGFEIASLKFKERLTFLNVMNLLSALAKRPKVCVFRPTLFNGLIRTLREASVGLSLKKAAQRVRNQNRLFGNFLPNCALGSTLLFKGLEAEVVVILNPETMTAENLYVVLTRGAKRIVVCSHTPLIIPKSQ